MVHTLSVSHGGIGTVALNRTGEWLALGCGCVQTDHDGWIVNLSSVYI